MKKVSPLIYIMEMIIDLLGISAPITWCSLIVRSLNISPILVILPISTDGTDGWVILTSSSCVQKICFSVLGALSPLSTLTYVLSLDELGKSRILLLTENLGVPKILRTLWRLEWRQTEKILQQN